MCWKYGQITYFYTICQYVSYQSRESENLFEENSIAYKIKFAWHFKVSPFLLRDGPLFRFFFYFTFENSSRDCESIIVRFSCYILILSLRATDWNLYIYIYMRNERFLNFSRAAVDVHGKRGRGCHSLVGLSVLSEIKILE